MSSHARLNDRAMDTLLHYDFPGNIRELEHMLEQAVALVQNGIITADDLIAGTPLAGGAPHTSGGRSLAEVVDAAEKAAIEGALRECDGSRERAADLLAISATTLWRKMTRLGIVFEGRG